MSVTETKRPLAQAIADAETFKAIFEGCYRDWTIAGSVRRRCPTVGDVEHVVIPVFGDVPLPGSGLFPQMHSVNLVWHRLEQLVTSGQAGKHLYGEKKSPRWGDKYRGVDWRGFNNEIFCADVDNHGSILAIRTGSVAFSRKLVTGLLHNHRRNKDGYVWECDPCSCSPTQRARLQCLICDNVGLVPRLRLSVGDEMEFFQLAGVPWAKPEDRS